MKVTLILSLFLVVGCASRTDLNSALYDQHLTRSYSSSKAKCFQATVKGLKKMGNSIWSQDAKSGLITTTERVIEDTQHEFRTSSFGTYQSGNAAPGVETQAVGVTESHQIYFKVTGNTSSCKVAVVKYKVWEDGVPVQGIHVGWHKTNIWEPLFSAIEANL